MGGGYAEVRQTQEKGEEDEASSCVHVCVWSDEEEEAAVCIRRPDEISSIRLL